MGRKSLSFEKKELRFLLDEYEKAYLRGLQLEHDLNENKAECERLQKRLLGAA